MFEREKMLNEFLLGYFEKIVVDIPADQIANRSAGNGHPPVWVLGHLALCSELGQTFCGKDIQHPEWMEVFGPGTSDDIADAGQYSKDQLVDLTVSGYPQFRQELDACDEGEMNLPHGLELLKNSPIKTKADLIAHLLTSHFSFHLAQLSGWRRASGKPALF